MARMVRPLLAVAALLAAPSAAVAQDAPAGWRVDDRRTPHPDVEVVHMVRERGPVVATVARVRLGDRLTARAVLSGNRVAGPQPRLERASAACARVACVVAVNADFALPESDAPVGGVVSGGRLLRSSPPTHHQLSIGGEAGFAVGTTTSSGRLVDTSLAELAVSGVNVDRGDDAVVLYTPSFGPSTATNRFGAELVLRATDGADPAFLGRTSVVELVALHDGVGDVAVPADGAVLSGHGTGAAAVRALWERVQRGEAGPRALLRLEAAPDAQESVGGSPVLVRQGRVWVADDGSGFVGGRHPRTAAGWTADGTLLLVTVDGRQPGHSVGMTLPELAAFLVEIGAVEALNLDGGGSTTFVVNGQVANRPSDALVRQSGAERIVPTADGDDVVGRVERPVASVLAVVPVDATPATGGDVAVGSLVPRPLDLPAPALDEASVAASGGRPALVAAGPALDEHGDGAARAVALFLALLAQTVVAALLLGHAGVRLRGTVKR